MRDLQRRSPDSVHGDQFLPTGPVQANSLSGRQKHPAVGTPIPGATPRTDERPVSAPSLLRDPKTSPYRPGQERWPRHSET